MALTDQQFYDHANQNNGEFANRRIVIKGTAIPGGSTIAPKYALYIRTTDNQEYINLGTKESPSWSEYPDMSGKEDVGAAQTEVRGGVVSAGDTLAKLYALIQSLGTGLSVPKDFDADTETLFPSGVSGDAYYVTVAGTVDTISLNVGDLFWTDTTTTSGAGSHVDWYILPGTGNASETAAGIVELATQAEAEATSSQSNAVVMTVLRSWQQIAAWWSDLKTTTGKDLSEIDFTSALNTKLGGIETGATADQSDTEIETAYNNRVSVASQAEAEAGTSTTVVRWTPQRIAQAINALKSSEAVTRHTVTISGHSFSVGDPIAVNESTNAYVLSVSGSSVLTHLGFVTAINGDDVTISENGKIDITGWGLASWTRYYLETDGSLITTDNGFPVLQTTTSTSANIIARSSGTSSGGGTSSSLFENEGVFDGTTNQVDLGRIVDGVLNVSLGGYTQRSTQYTVDSSGATTIVTFEDDAATVNGLGYRITSYRDIDISNVSVPYYVEGIFDGSTNEIDLNRKADDVLLTAVDGTVYRRSLYTIDNSGATTIITLSDSAASLNGRPYHVAFINDTAFGANTVDWTQIIGNRVPDGNDDDTYYLRPQAGSGGYYELAVLPSATTPNLQQVTTAGATSTLAITVGGLSLSNYSTRSLLYVDTDSGVKQVTLGTGLSISAGGQLDAAFLPLTGGTVSGDTTFQGNLYLSGLASGFSSNDRVVIVDTGTKILRYTTISLDRALNWGNTSALGIEVGSVLATNLASGSDKLVYASATGALQAVTLGANLSFTGGILSATGGSGGVTISGTPNYISKFNGAGDNVINSQLRDDGTSIGVFTAPIAGSSFRVIKSNTTNLATFGNTATSGDVLRLELPTGASGTQLFIEGYQGSTERFKIDVTGKATFQSLNINLSAASTLPLKITTAGNVIAQAIDYSSNEITNKPTIYTTLASLLDTSISSPSSGNLLGHNGSNWVPVSITGYGSGVANAGPDYSISLSSTSYILLDGTRSTGSITSYAWSKESGGLAYYVGNNLNAPVLLVTGLSVGTYVFRLTVSDSFTGSDFDDITITVNA